MIDIVKISLIFSVFSFLGEPDMIFAPYRRLIMKLPDWLNKPLGSCHLCITGQAMFWYYLITWFDKYKYNDDFESIINSLIYYFNVIIEHLFYVSASIFLSAIFAMIWYFTINWYHGIKDN